MTSNIIEITKNEHLSITNFDQLSNIVIKSGADFKLELIRLNEKEELNTNFSISVEKNAKVEIVIVDLSNRNSTIEGTVTLDDFSEATLKLGALSDSISHKKYILNVDQKGVKSKSLVSMLGVATDESKLEFLGSTKIYKGAIKSTARQESRIADLSDKVRSVCSPALLIDENDIMASHGAALGQIEENQLFYLMSRGLTKQEAETIITLGYLKPVINLINSKESQEKLSEYIESKVNHHARSI